MKRLIATLVLVAAPILGACSGDNKVGNESLLNVKDQVGSRLGAATTTTAPPATTTSVASLGIGRPTTTRPTGTTTVAEFVITINGDSSGKSQFEPNTATVFTNYKVRWQNSDAKARSVVFDEGGHAGSGDIAPGASWTTTFSSPGTYHYTDGTRPYAVASITVVAR
jgi:plastocyanin